jgi:hypothetical protein
MRKLIATFAGNTVGGDANRGLLLWLASPPTTFFVPSGMHLISTRVNLIESMRKFFIAIVCLLSVAALSAQQITSFPSMTAL